MTSIGIAGADYFPEYVDVTDLYVQYIAVPVPVIDDPAFNIATAFPYDTANSKSSGSAGKHVQRMRREVKALGHAANRFIIAGQGVDDPVPFQGP